MSDRLQRIEDLLSNLASKDTGRDTSKSSHVQNFAPRISGFSSTSDDEDSDSVKFNRRGRKSKRPFGQSRFLPEGETLTSFESVILLQAKTLQYAVEHGLDPIGIIHHLKFLATKATAASYKPEAFIGYDDKVRQRADREGISAFADISHEDVLLHFCHENMVFRDKTKKKVEAGKKKSGQKYCNNYNDSECLYKNCVFLHRCMACDDASHGRKSCPNIKRHK